MKLKYPFIDEWKINTLDIAMAVVIGVIEAAIEITGALGFLDRIWYIAGPPGWLWLTAYNGITTVLFTSLGYLRRRMAVVLLASLVLAVVRWLFGDPDGPLLLYYALGAALPGVVVMWLRGWKDDNLTYFLGNGVTISVAIMLAYTTLGIEMVGGPVWAVAVAINAFFWGGLWGIVARYLGKALQRVGIARVQREWDVVETVEAEEVAEAGAE